MNIVRDIQQPLVSVTIGIPEDEYGWLVSHLPPDTNIGLYVTECLRRAIHETWKTEREKKHD